MRTNQTRQLRTRHFIALIALLLVVAPAAGQGDAATLNWGFTANGIPTLMDASGMTLYTFANDDGGASTCYEQCAEAWPPYLADAAPTGVDGVTGTFSTTERDDGSMQVTYNGWPLYYFARDAAPGDANGQGIRDLWFAANPAAVFVTEKAGLGPYLVGPGGMTLYVFLEDHEDESYCFEECAVAWPPLIVPEGMEPTAAGDVPGELGTTERDDGSTQLTYYGWPLYFFKGDGAPGDTNGNALKNVWYVAHPEETAAETPSVSLELVAEGLAAPVAFVSAGDGSGRMFIADLNGYIYILSGDGSMVEEPFLDLTAQLPPLDPGYDERGLLGLAFHPDYANNGRIFLYFSVPLRDGAPEGWDHTNLIAEVSVSADDPNRADLGTLRNIMSIDQPQMNHNAGQIIFGPDGYLYIPIGDGGGGNDTGLGHTPEIGNAQDTTNLHGSILRIDVDGEHPYAIPADNPFASPDDGVLDEIWAYGLRNPFHISFDSSGRLFVGDAGQELYEEVTIVGAGENHGWFIKEGRHCFDPDNPEQPPATCADTGAMGEPLVDPIVEYDHSKGNVVVGGYVYEGSAIPELSGQYVFGSYSLTGSPPNGLLFAAAPGAADQWEMREIAVANGENGRMGAFLLSFAQGEDGELYVLTSENSAPFGTTGKIWRMIAASGTEAEEAPNTTDVEQPDTSGIPSSVGISAALTSDNRPTLVGPDGRTLYTFAHDHDGSSTCYGNCAIMWPPLLVGDGGASAAGEGLPGVVDTIDRTDGATQVTYNGWPLYFYMEDAAPGDANGHGESDVWFVANPGTVMVGADSGTLVGPGGLTLYVFEPDEDNESYCYEECAVAWYPLTVDPDAQPIAGAGVAGTLATTERTDGLTQVTYNGAPLYFFKGDMAPGDQTGHGVKEIWFTAAQ